MTDPTPVDLAETRARHVRSEYEKQAPLTSIKWELLHVLIRREIFQAIAQARREGWLAAKSRACKKLMEWEGTAHARGETQYEVACIEAQTMILRLPFTPPPEAEGGSES